ncbi:UDP-glucuronosyltransferase 2C1 [Nasonia vitripennis]|uniref:UDP-glucuronosyltransferase n=1 Tax=Nasonia vitripennis TaxID=7425 RepID=A0A7M7QSD5_NASVI|nr:UDP-glucuronosyltransferase 2C1 [Nasonia vitripennis]XP_032453959.1 UDP-glucuronosyltransferase 2C1 [Nasonia vitripennis]
MKVTNVLLFLATIGSVEICSGYRILGIYPVPIRSHFIIINQLLKGLADKGHQVDLISIFPEKEKLHPNYTQIITLPGQLSEIIPIMNITTVRKFGWDLSSVADFGYRICENMGNPEFLKLARNPPKDPPYDVIITHMFSYHCYAVLGHLWNIPVVLVSTTSLYPWMHVMIGNPENVAFSPNNLIPVPEGNSFWTRFYNTYVFNMLKFSFFYYSTNQDQLLRKYFGPDVPSVREIERNVSLVLMNTYFPINGVKPMTTNLIEIGGLHIQNEGPELEEKLKKWLDESKDGVILFTFGSMMQVETLPNETVEIIFKTLARVAPTRVLIRIAEPQKLTVKVPNNVYHLPWIPQQKVLQHRNIKLFITHGGLLGTQESIYYGKPMLCLPIVADQWTNTRNYVSKKIALMLELMELKQEEFDYTVNELLNNPTYSENTKRLSRLFRDRPQSAMDTAAFWIEFVVRNGKDTMRSPVLNLTWWQVALLDVYAVTFAILFTALYIAIFILKCLLRLVCCTNSKTVSRKKKES